MKSFLLIWVNLSLSFFAFGQHSMSMKTDPGAAVKRLPFYTKIGNRDIYHIYIGDTTVNYTGKARPAMAINGSIPAPTLTFTEGDTAEIYVHNNMMMETSIHWHGLILPNRYDGVSYLTTSPVKAGETHLYKFPLVQHGTYWYHSHTMTQQQSGMYGAFIINEKKPSPIKDYTLLLSDWTDENPDQVQRRLHNATDWFAIQKGSTQNYLEAIREGHFKTKVANEWKRMTAMDVSDVYYDRFFSNGKSENTAPQFKAGDKVRLHVVNGSSSTYFWLNYAGGKISVVANDGEDVEPVEVDRLIIAVAETYDVVVTIPKDGSYEFLATPEDRTKFTSLWLGSGTPHKAAHLPRLKYFEGMKMMNDMMDMNGNMKGMEGMEMSNQVMDMNTVMYPEITGEAEKPTAKKKEIPHTDGMKMDSMGDKKMEHEHMAGMDMNNSSSSDIVTLNYGMLKSTKVTTLPKGPTKLLRFDLTGNMNRYVWSINNKTVSESDKILIKSGENVRIILYNNTMMRHPMHLHGHYFRVLNGQGEYAPLKNTLDIMPMERDTIEFRATESGDWFFHCHILYHMMSGMGRIFSYENSPPNPEIPDPAKSIKKIYADDQHFYASAKVGLESIGSDGNAALANTRWKFSTLWHLGYNDRSGYESETMIGRYFGQMQWLYAYGGFDYHYQRNHGAEKNLFGQVSNKSNRKTVVAGVAYTLPMLFVADARIDGNGKLRFQLSRDDIPLTSRLRFTIMGNTDKEYAAGFRYIINKSFSLSTHYDSDMGLGGGLTLTY
ncbi:multicopper oxidase domain-containing protein [Mucilaginibacter sabulilitoris]|uniref:Multicopper oxidase domain-containing protein n=1 Tax=Mucilaginibacter sabulilitoris TaxID=1173583 RepID=A0ABZ0TV55_9SPHI|nr:multicopper oxidase domain-containing protein [Mucilaginibacter sabulilitoris]WPU95020.1 multicopper oxidase domain-containing protein [Mucilaginibacter sabulilitoris]